MTNKPKTFYLMPYIVGIMVFAYSLKLFSPFLLALAIVCMFVAFMKPIHDWKKTLKKNRNSNDKE